MKFSPSLLRAAVLSLGISTSLFAADTVSLQQVLNDGNAAMARGDYTTAKKNFEIVVQADPKNQTAQNYLRMIAVRDAQQPKGNELEKQLEKVILPKLELREATFNSALEYVRQQVTKVSGGKASVNFVVQLPEVQANAQVTLMLSNVPVTEALRYMGELAGAQLIYDKYAVMVKPKPGAAIPVASNPATAPVQSTTPAVPGL